MEIMAIHTSKIPKNAKIKAKSKRNRRYEMFSRLFKSKKVINPIITIHKNKLIDW